MAKLKIGGTWAGVIEVVLEEWTVPMLRIEVAKRSNCGPESINLICAGKVLRDGDGTEKLAQLGVKNNARILASRGSIEEGKSLEEGLLAEEERSRRLSRVKAAATALAKRHADGSLPVEDFNIEVEDQSGQIVQLGSETDQRAVMMGLMLHANGKQLIRSENYKDALEVLTMGELIDNVPILQMDMVWCYFMLRDIRWLSVAGARLEKAREGIERAHGKDYSRVRLLQAGRHPELAIHLRLELLEGVVAYHNGEFDRSRKALTSAHAKYFQLQVPDEALSLVMSMGFKERDAKRALRMSNQDVGSAVDFLVEEKAKRAQKREEDIRRRTEIMEQKRYGMTPSKKAVDLNKLNELVSVGFEKELAAEALRRNENDFEKALDNLTDPAANSAIQVDIESRKRKRTRQASETAIEQLVRMGFERSRAVAALQAGGTIEQAMHQLLSQSDSNPTVGADNSANSSAPILPDASGSSNDVGGPSTASEAEERDAEMEDALAGELAKGDALTDYDIEVTNEGEAINEYLALLESAGNSVEASRQ
ncbi:NEDD8 ultimate buster 1 isoform X2 [Juglans microcarpa x Juglans regia]|uniref:NEDD8 ultimate buster 1 isoform X2 n=1 Tax=Juglans microcarpa x Juglans regia TaxID=2249226 RepID=UPI001B7DCC1D|nr:NEDD8 ultimate buster 1 isoform X2 [Juglans microcarpa x Juglans regia]